MNRLNLILHLLSILFYFSFNNVLSLDAEGIIGGRDTEPGDIKYLASLQRQGRPICGAGIISNKFLLTAAHCVINSKTNQFKEGPMKIVAGTNNLKTANNFTVKIDVARILVPEAYNVTLWKGDTPRGDIAVLELKQNLNIDGNERLQKLVLPPGRAQPGKNKPKLYESYDYTVVTLAGFGWDHLEIIKFNNGTGRVVGSSSYRMHQADALVINYQKCQKYYETTVRESNICARVIEQDDGTSQGACNGDSGSPLVYKDNTVIGVASATGLLCNEKKTPAMYTRVSSYIQFIEDAINGKTDSMRVHEFQQ